MDDLTALSELAPELAQMLVSVAGDLVVVLDTNGIVQRVTLGGAEPVSSASRDWVGKTWLDTVTSETRCKLEDILRDVNVNGVSRLRQVNHISPSGSDIPIGYTAVRLGASGTVLAVGRDMRAVAAAQQRFVETQQAMERDYWRRSQAQTRYRLLYEIATEAILLVDAATFRVVEANRAASSLFAISVEEFIGKRATSRLDIASQALVEEMFATTCATGRSQERIAQLAESRGNVRISATLYRSDGESLLLTRARPQPATQEGLTTAVRLANLVQQTPDAVAIADTGGALLFANAAMLRLLQLESEQQIKGRLLGDWLTNGGLQPIVARLRKEFVVPLVTVSLRGEQGRTCQGDCSAVLLLEDGVECVGLIVRPSQGYRFLEQDIGSTEFPRAVH